MREEKHYCDRCKKEIKYFYLGGNAFYLTVKKNTYNELVKGDKTGVLLKYKSSQYELCHKCKKDFRKFMKGK